MSGKLRYYNGSEWEQIAPTKQEFDDLQKTTTTHLAENVSITGDFIRNGTIGGVQTILLDFKPNVIIFYGYVYNSQFNGVATKYFQSVISQNSGMCIGVMGDGTLSLENLSPKLKVSENYSDFFEGIVSIKNNGFDINWSVGGVGIDKNIEMKYTAIGHSRGGN